MDVSKVTRVEVIDSEGRSYSNSNCADVELDLQDGGRTLKIFTREGNISKEQVSERIIESMRKASELIDFKNNKQK